MPSEKKTLRFVLVAMVNCIGAYLSFRLLGGFLVFGSGGSFSGFCLFVVPVLALPIALIAWWNVRLATVVWSLAMLLIFGVQAGLVWPEAGSLAKNGFHFLTFLAGWVLLLWGAVLETQQSSRKGT